MMDDLKIFLSEDQDRNLVCLDDIAEKKGEIKIYECEEPVPRAQTITQFNGYVYTLQTLFRYIWTNIRDFVMQVNILKKNMLFSFFVHNKLIYFRVSEYLLANMSEIHHRGVIKYDSESLDPERRKFLQTLSPIYSQIVAVNSGDDKLKFNMLEKGNDEVDIDYSYLDEIRSLSKMKKDKNKIFFGSLQEYKDYFVPLITKVAEYEQKTAKSKGVNRVSNKCSMVSQVKNVYKFFFRKNKSMNIKKGDLILVKYYPHDLIERRGHVTEVSSKKEWIMVIMDATIIMTYNLFYIEVIWIPVIFDRIMRAFKVLGSSNFPIHITNIILGSKNNMSLKLELPSDCNVSGLPMLNNSQIEVIERAIMQKVSLIQGPPGTGKTITCAALVYHLVKRYNASVLVCGPSNISVDQLFKNISKTGIKVKRIYAKYKEKEIELKKLRSSGKIQDITENSDDFDSHFTMGDSKYPFNAINADSVTKELYESSEKVEITETEFNRRVETHNKCELTLEYHTENNLCINSILTKPLPKKISSSYNFSHYVESTLSNQPKSLLPFDKISEDVDVICATCIGAGVNAISKWFFDVVLIDEAGQITEPECLVPISLCKKQLILVGDHFQLSPVVPCQEAVNKGLSLSMFERLIYAGVSPLRLEIQYRMHPAISEFSSLAFYNGTIKNGVTLEARTYHDLLLKWPSVNHPLLFYCSYGPESVSSTGTSYYNIDECNFVVKCATILRKSGVDQSQIGVITPYDGQRQKIVQIFKKNREYGVSLNEITVANIHGFQGQEKDFIIISCVRSNNSRTVGFMNDYRMMNVSITRAKYGLIIVGNPNVLRSSIIWGPLLRYYMEKNLLVTCPEDIFMPTNRHQNELSLSVINTKDNFKSSNCENVDLRDKPIAEKNLSVDISTSLEDLMQRTLSLTSRSNIQQKSDRDGLSFDMHKVKTLSMNSVEKIACENYTLNKSVRHSNAVKEKHRKSIKAKKIISDPGYQG